MAAIDHLQRRTESPIPVRRINSGVPRSTSASARSLPQTSSPAWGNQVTQHLLGSVVQAKLTVSQPGDQFEREADRVADSVMRIPDETAPAVLPGGLIQRACADCEEEMQRQATEELEEEETLEAKAAPGQTPSITPGLQAQIGSIRGGGAALPPPTRRFFEPRFGTDFEGVRVHTDSRAVAAARAVKAEAFTLGHDIVFNEGRYEPETTAGRRLLAHELTHVVQQGEGRSLNRQTEAGAGEEPEAELITVQPGLSDLSPEDVNRKAISDTATILRVPSGPATGNCSWNCPAAGATPYSATTSSAFNCYAYAMNSPSSGTLRPGQIAATNLWRARFGDPTALAAVGGTAGLLSYFTPSGVRQNLDADLGSHISANCNNCCSSPKRKIIAVTTDNASSVAWTGSIYAGVLPGGSVWDFHFYRKDSDKAWSHKRDGLPSERVDGSGAGPICSPCRVDRGYPGASYTQVVGSWCV